MEEKELIKRENLNIFQKLKIFLKKIFFKQDKNECVQKTEKNVIKNINKENDFKEKEKITILQQKYEDGEILESDLTEEERIKLEELYKQQIKVLEYNINEYNNKLKKYKSQIIEAKKKVENNK